MRSDFRNVSEQPQCVTEGNSKGQAGADACHFVVSRRQTWHADKGMVSWIFCVTCGGGGQNGNSWRLQQGSQGVPS